MRLLVMCFLAVAGWVAAAPGPLSTTKSSDDTPDDLQQEPRDDNLAPALNDLARRKRGGVKASLPYSNYRPSGGMHRYRYPLYRKRSYRPQPSYDYEDEVILPESENDYLNYDDQARGPSLFRERSLQQQQQDRRKKEMVFEDDGYFSDDYISPDKKYLPSPFVLPLKKKNSMYNSATTPYDLRDVGHMYDIGKREESPVPLIPSPYEIDALTQIHSVGRKSPPRMSATEQFYDAIDAIQNKNAMFDERIMNPSEAENMEHLLKLKNFLSSAAGSRYLRARNGQEGVVSNARDPMIRRRRKRDTVSTNSKGAMKTPNATSTHKDLTATTVPNRYHDSHIFGDRRKRAFNDYFDWERKALASEYQPMDKRTSRNSKDFNDYLTREYFKSIARSVGQKKKRMAYAQFEADKRTAGLDEFLENPAMLEYMQSKLREAEEEVTEEAEKELGEGDTEELLSNIVVRLDALERMREALLRLEELQNEEEKPQRSMPSGLSVAVRKRQSSSGSSSSGTAAAAAYRKRSDSSRKKKQSAVDARRIRRMRREENTLPAVLLGNTRGECPVLERILVNCVGASETVGDQDQAFLESCIRHEVCYLCGSGLSVSGHECDAILSSSLEAACSSNLDCLSAAGDTFNLLSNADRYDEAGTCTHDPCVRQFLESR